MFSIVLFRDGKIVRVLDSGFKTRDHAEHNLRYFDNTLRKAGLRCSVGAVPASAVPAEAL